MKKQGDSKIFRLISSIFNVRAWFDWDRVRAFTLYLVTGFKKLFVPQKPQQVDSFKEVSKKMDLNDESLSKKEQALLRLSILMLSFACIILGYAGYQLFYGSIKAFLVSFVLTLIALTLAFRYHFWYYQIRHRKLGCTFDEWFRQGLLGEKK